MADMITKQELAAAKLDVKHAGEAVNEKKVVNPRYGESFYSLPLAIQIVLESGGFEPFATEAQLKASVPVLTKKAAYALNTHKVWLWNNGQWTDTGLSAIDQAKAYVDSSARFKDKEIVAGTDLNTVVTFGTHICRNNSNATLGLNYPVAQAGSLTVDRYSTDGAVYQEYSTTSGRKYVRAKTGSTWGLWFKQANSDDVEAARAAAAADASTKSALALVEAKAYVDSSARFKDKEIVAGTDLNTVVTFGTHICRNNSNATLGLNYPVAQAGSLTVDRYSTDGAVYQEYSTTSGRKYVRAKTGSTWGLWFKQANSDDVEAAIQPVPLLTTQSLDDVRTTGKYIARFDTTASFEMKYPIKAPGVLDVTNNPGDSTVFQTFETLNNVVYKRTFTANEWSEWSVLNELDSAFYQLFTSDLVAYDFSDLKCFLPAKINSSLSRVYPVKGSDRLSPFTVNADAIAKYSSGKISLTGRSETTNNRLSASKPLLGSLSSTLAFSFKYRRSDAQLNVIWQHAPSVAGRLQININAVYNGSTLTNSPNSFQVFLNGASEGSGSSGNIKNKMLSTDVMYRVILSIAPGSKASRLFINGELIDSFTVAEIAKVNTQVLGFIGGRTQAVEISKILAVQEVVNEEQISEIDFWLGKFESSNFNEDNEVLKDLALLTSQSAAAAIIPENGIYNPNLLLYSQNETHVGLQASLTKIITSVVLLDLASNLNQMITRTEEDVSGGSGSNLSVGDSISIYSALRNLMLPSSNVTAKIIARIFGGQLLIAGGVDAFTTEQAISRWVVELNTKAQLIGMSETVFASPDGLDTSSSSQAKTTALDIVKLICYASRYNDLMKAWSEPAYAMPVTNNGATRIVNIATTVVPLSSGDEYVYGGKTGTLNRYGYNVAEVSILPDGRKVALVTLGASSDADRTADIRTVMNAVATKFDWSSRPRKTA